MVETTKNLGGAPKDNQNAAKGKRWANAIQSALEKRSRLEGQQALNQIAEKLIEAAENGEAWALKELGDRFDGKPAQSVTVAGDEDAPLQIIGKVNLVRPKPRD